VIEIKGMTVRYTYGLTTALLLGGASLSLTTGFPVDAQVPKNFFLNTPRDGAPSSFANLIKKVQPAVVNISTRQKVKVENANPLAGTPFGDMFGAPQTQGQEGQTREAQSLGSGFVISADGYVVTNNHVISGEGKNDVESISVTMPDGTEFPAKLIGRDVASDLAVLKIEPHKSLPFVKFGESKDARVGDWIIAIGNPFGLGGTVTAGIISAITRNTGSGGAYDRYLQTDAAINRGNSGGPMFDMRGRVIGINNAIYSPTGGSIGIGLAIPSDTASPIVTRLMQGKTIDRGYLGVRIAPLTEDLADSLGIPHNRGEFIQGVEPGKGAAVAGIQAGDVVLMVAGRVVSPGQSLSFIVANTAPGSRIAIDLLRNGQRLTVTATVGKRPSEEELAKGFDPDAPDADDPYNKPQKDKPSGLADKAMGLTVLPITPQIARQLGVNEATKGLVIAAVDPSSDAAAKGLLRGDVIIGVNFKPIINPSELDNAITDTKASGRAAILLQVMRRGQNAIYIPVRLR
jgi:serine protease Do